MNFLITGATGHLGSTIIRSLKQNTNNKVYGLVLEQEDAPQNEENVIYIKGDITNLDTLDRFFENSNAADSIVIHTAGLISIEDKVSPRLYNINVDGTKNIIAMCKKYDVKRLVYISSVDALGEEKGEEGLISERKTFDLDKIRGGYAYTKALSSEFVLNATSTSLETVVIFPSCILGPGDTLKNNYLNKFVFSLIKKHIPISLEGGFDFVDVRDVASGVISASLYGKSGEGYILSNRYYTVDELEKHVQNIVGGHRKPCLSLKFISLFIPLLNLISKMTKHPSLITKYSLHTLRTKLTFSHKKADEELGYTTRDIEETIKDMKAELEILKLKAQLENKTIGKL